MEQRIIDCISRALNCKNIDTNSSQMNCKSWDSMGQLNIVIELEEEFGISLEPDEIVNMKDVHSIIKIISSKY